MLRTSENRHTAEENNANEYRAGEINADYTSKPQPLCFAFIDPLPKDIGGNIGDVAIWYREQMAMLDKAGDPDYKSISSSKDAKSEFYMDKISDEAGEVLASSGAER